MRAYSKGNGWQCTAVLRDVVRLTDLADKPKVALVSIQNVLAQIARAWKHGKCSERIAGDLDAERIPTKGEGRW